MAEAAGLKSHETLLKLVDQFILTGIGSAEEYARNAARQGLNYTSRAKLEHATTVAKSQAPPELKPLIDEAAVEAKMPLARAHMSLIPPSPSGLPPPSPELFERIR